jgi:hypothetical protein
MSNEADTCRRFVVPRLQAAGWDSEPERLRGQVATATRPPRRAGLWPGSGLPPLLRFGVASRLQRRQKGRWRPGIRYPDGRSKLIGYVGDRLLQASAHSRRKDQSLELPESTFRREEHWNAA